MNKYEIKLELNHILEQLKELCIISKTKSIVEKLEPSNDLLYLNDVLDKVDEALMIIARFDRAPIMMSESYVETVEIAKKGGVLTGQELYVTVKLLNTIKANIQFLETLKKENIACQYYSEFVDNLYLNEFLYSNLVKSIDETGYVLDSASMNLSSIRRRIILIDGKIKSKLQEIVSKDTSKLSQATISMRDNHYVVPVKIEHKNSFKGNILDVSGTGQTVYIEPLAVVELTNQKAELIQEEKKEIEKILRNLSFDIGRDSDVLIENYNIIVNIDLIFAKAMLAKKQNAERPQINFNHQFDLINARHPLLKVKKVIPNNLCFNDYLGIIITGPNTGGKTVLLKTVGLLSLMVKYGLLIPADKNSNIMIFDYIFCDIGDDQSIIENLSTFSGHMSNIVDIINNVTPNSLVLFDEIGGGTDPTEGSNLAISILEHLVDNRIAFITTTHYSELKTYAYSSEKIVNASMEFDKDTLSPTYRLKLGVPGSSNAFDIATRLGLSKCIIDKARSLSKESETDVSLLIKKLETMSLYYEQETLKAKEQIEKAELSEKLFKKRLESLEKEKDKIIKDAYAEAESEINLIKEDALNVLSKIKDQNAKNIKLHEIIALQKDVKDINTEIIEKPKPKQEDNRPLRLGDDVYVPDYDQYGSVTKVLKDGKYTVSLGNVTMTLTRNKLQYRTKVEPKKQVRVSTTKLAKSSSMSIRLDLRGERYEDAKEKLDKYFDDALLYGIKQFTIIHGYGTGTIRTLVLNYLKNNRNVESHRFGVDGEGGMGVTVVTLK